MSNQSDIINANFSYLNNKIKEMELYKTPNVLIQGEPTINNGQVTNLSKTNYLILPFQFDPKDRGFELTYCFRTGADVTTPQNLYGSKFSIASYVQNGKLTIRVSSNGTSWNVLDLVTSLDVQPNTAYYIKLIFNRLNYTIKASTDGVEYSQIGYVVNTGVPFAGDVYIGIGNNQNNPFLGMINLHKWELKYNNSVFWEGMDDAGLATRADISLSNLDEEGESRFTAKQDVISDLSTIRTNASSAKSTVDTHVANTTIHVTASDKTAWSQKQNAISDLDDIRSNAQAGKNASDTISTYGDIVTHNANEFATNTALSQGLATKQDTINDLETIRSNAQDGKDIIPQVNVNTQRIEDLTTAKFPNVVIIGTPHIEGGQVSNYSDTSYLQFPFVDISRGQPFDIYFSFTTAQDVTTQQNILDAYFGIALAIQNGKGVMALSSNGTSWDIGTSFGTNTLLPNTTYYVKYSWTGTEYSAALSTDDQTYVPDMNLASTLSPHKTTIFIGGSPNIFGAGSAHPFKGTINFNKSKVVVNGITVWEGMADVGLASRANVSLNNLDEVGEGRFNAKQDKLPTLENGKFLTNNGSTLSWSSVEALPSQTGNDGKFLTTNGTTASWGDALVNTNSNNGLTILGRADNADASINIGKNSKVTGAGSVAIGISTEVTGNYSVAIGLRSYAFKPYSVAIGCEATGALKGIQLGTGTGETRSLTVGLWDADDNFHNYKLLAGDGKIPTDRIPDLSSTYASTTALGDKQDTLISGTNIKTIGGESLLGSGDIEVSSYHPSLLSFQWTDHILNEMSWLRADTFSWQDGNTYKTVYDKLVEEYNNGTNEYDIVDGIQVDYRRGASGFKIANANYETAILNRYNSTGVAWYYILDTENRRFKLPRTKYGFTGLRDGVGNYVPESLPNIKGSFYTSDAYGFDAFNYADGMFYKSGGTGWQATTTNITISGKSNGVLADASRSSSTYKDNAPVQQRATQMYLYFYVGEFSQTAVEQTAGITTEVLNTKANDIDVVHKSGDEDINGIKTFNGDGWITRIKNTEVQKTVAPSSFKATSLVYLDKDNNSMAVVELARHTDNNSEFYLNVQAGDGSWHKLGVGTNQAGDGYVIIDEDVRQNLAGRIIQKVSTLPATQQTGVLYVIPE